MKSMLKWSVLFVIPSLILFYFIYADLTSASREDMALFFTLHYFFSGIAIFFVLRDFNRNSKEQPGMIRFILTGIMTAVVHGMLIGLITALYFNVVNPEIKASYMQEKAIPGIVRSHDSTVNSIEEWKSLLMQGVDSGVLLPDVYAERVQAVEDSMQLVQHEIVQFETTSFGYYSSTMKWIAFAPFIGILFSIIIVIFIFKKR